MRISKLKPLFFCFSCAISLFLLIELLHSSGTLALDDLVTSFVVSLQVPLLVYLALMVHFVFNTFSLLGIGLCAALYIYYRHIHLRRETYFLVVFIILNALSVFLLKHIVMRARPLDAILTLQDYSFPSGHTAAAVVLFGLLLHLRLTYTSRFKGLFTLAAVSSIVLIAFSRLYLAVHWMTDVIGGLLLGLFWLFLGLFIMRFQKA